MIRRVIARIKPRGAAFTSAELMVVNPAGLPSRRRLPMLSTRVSVFSINKLFRMTLMPALVLAQMLCVCAGTVASPPRAGIADRDAGDEHACCDQPSSESKSDKAPSGNHKHDPDCQHCGGSSTLTTPGAGSKIADPAQVVALASLFPLHFDSSALDPANRFQSFSRWLADPAPPPDLLRVKCSLQI